MQPSRSATIGKAGTPPTIKNGKRGHNRTLKSESSRSGNQPGSLWQLAELEILSCRELCHQELSSEVVSYSSLRLEDSNTSESKGSDGRKNRKNRDIYLNCNEGRNGSGLFECEIRLVTGRTHQIRLQLAAIGASILGDTRYNPVEGLLDTTEDDRDIDGVTHDMWDKVKVTRAGLESRYDPIVGVKPVAVGDGNHLMGPEPKR